jgi:hypothetical protein
MFYDDRSNIPVILRPSSPMRTSILPLIVAVNMAGAPAQTVVFTEPFDTDPFARDCRGWAARPSSAAGTLL